MFVDGFVSDGDEDYYELRTFLAPDTGAFPEYRNHLYYAEDGKAVLRIVEHGLPSASRGLGSVVLTYSGPGNAPALLPGQAAHVIEDLTMSWRAERLP